MICLYTVRQSFSFLDYHFLHDKAQQLYAERISKYLHCSSNDSSTQNSKVFTCKQCMKQFKHAGSLAQHVRMHTNIESFRCPICMKLFSRIYDMKTHVKCRHPEFLTALRWFYLPHDIKRVNDGIPTLYESLHLFLYILCKYPTTLLWSDPF